MGKLKVKKKILTIEMIAKRANTSISTVSRALNDNPRISQKTKQKIMQIAREVGYSSKERGRSMNKKSLSLVGMIGFDFQNLGMYKIAAAVRRTIQKSGYWMLLANSGYREEKANYIINSWVKSGIEGIIYASTNLENPLVEKLIDEGYPIVLVNRKLKRDKGDYVIFDNDYGVYLGVNHLLNLGYKKIAMIRTPLDHSTSIDRYNGYLRALKDRNIKLNKRFDVVGDYTQQAGYRLTNQLFSLDNKPDAIFCCDDYVALGAMQSLAELALKVPDDVGIMGMDDIDICSHALIQLSTIRPDLDEMGKLGAEILLDRIEGKEPSQPRRIKLEPQLIIRHSCGYTRSVTIDNDKSQAQ